MLKGLNITRNYSVGRTYDEQFNLLESIVAASFHDTKYTIFGNYFLTEPPEFIFMAKWVSAYPSAFSDIASTKLSVRLLKDGSNATMIVTTESNPVIVLLICTLVIAFIVNLLRCNNSSDIKHALVFMMYPLLVLFLDRFIKRLLVASFERDMKLSPK